MLFSHTLYQQQCIYRVFYTFYVVLKLRASQIPSSALYKQSRNTSVRITSPLLSPVTHVQNNCFLELLIPAI